MRLLLATLRLWTIPEHRLPAIERIRAADGSFIWRVSIPGEPSPREHPSIVGVLRTLRAALVPDRPAGRLIVAPRPPER